MTSKEIVRRVIRHQDPPRLAWDFLDGIHKDTRGNGCIQLLNERNALTGVLRVRCFNEDV
jgi:hypothetical protein